MTFSFGTGVQPAVDGVTSHFLSGTTTFFNIFQALVGNEGLDEGVNTHPFGIVVNVLIALLLVAISEKFFNFMTKTLPSWILLQFRKCVSHRDAENAAAVDVFVDQPERYMFDNALLVLALERYVAHLLRLKSERGGEAPPLRLGECRYAPVAVPEGGGRRGAAATLRRHYRLLVLPADGHAVEVEPGLTVCFQGQMVPASALRRGRVVPRRGGQPNMRDFIPLNFDAFLTRLELARAGGAKHDDHNDSDSGDGDKRESEFGGPFFTPDATQQQRKVLVRQAILQCTDKKKATKDSIMDFARRAYAWYYPSVVESVERYYYVLSRSTLEGASGFNMWNSPEDSQRVHMRRFPLCKRGCDFGRLFFSQKSQLLTLLEEFKQKQGRFALPGVPQQLLILLYGMPGTGKTSIVRSMASFLGRHIVSLPITLIQTNGALQEILSGGTVVLSGDKERDKEIECECQDTDFADIFDRKTSVPPTYDLSVNQAMYVFEDIEVLSDMASFQLLFKQRSHISLTPTKTALCEEEEEEMAEGKKKKNYGSVAAESFNTLGSGSECHARDEELGSRRPESNASRTNFLKLYQKLLVSDVLSPEGLLRALEPTFAPPGRVVIFTTNHPEKLPAVFWRPGVLTTAIHLGDFDTASAMDFISLYCHDSMTPTLQARFETLFARCEAGGLSGIMNPASLEHMTTAHSDAEELIEALERQC